MPLITLDDACLAFGHVALLDKAAFQLDPGERVALIGRNGSGKSSLLKALAGQSMLDDGRLWRQPGARVAYVPQEADFPLERSVYATVADGLGDVAQLLVDYHAAMLAVADDHSEAALARLARDQGFAPLAIGLGLVLFVVVGSRRRLRFTRRHGDYRERTFLDTVLSQVFEVRL